MTNIPAASPKRPRPLAAGAGHPGGGGMNLDEQLMIVADYADQIATADQAANRGTMAVAEAMEALYESRVWVAEWLEQKPEPKRPTSRWQADSRNRFSQWQAWKLEQIGRKPVLGRHTYQLLDAMRVARAIPNLRAAQIGTEWNLRPLKWLLTNRYEDRIPEVWAIAVELAGSPENVTAKHTREALAQWKKKMLTGRGGGKSPSALTAAAKAHRLRQNMLDELRAMYELACRDERARDEFEGTLDEIQAFLDSKAIPEAAA